MRLSIEQQRQIKHEAQAIFGEHAEVFVFGSRVDDNARGGDVDVLVKTPAAVERPALRSAQLAARLSRHMQGRKVDVVVSAAGLQRTEIHQHAERTGVRL